LNKILELYTYITKKGIHSTIKRIRKRYLSITGFTLFKKQLDKNVNYEDTKSIYDYCIGDISILNQYREKNHSLPREFYIDRTHNANEFYLGYYNGHLAQICWVFSKGEYSRFFSIKNYSTCEVNYLTTLQDFRGKGDSAKIINYICNQVKSRGVEKVVGGIASTNVLMIRGMESIGFTPFKCVKTYLSVVSKTDV